MMGVLSNTCCPVERLCLRPNWDCAWDRIEMVPESKRVCCAVERLCLRRLCDCDDCPVLWASRMITRIPNAGSWRFCAQVMGMRETEKLTKPSYSSIYVAVQATVYEQKNARTKRQLSHGETEVLPTTRLTNIAKEHPFWDRRIKLSLDFSEFLENRHNLTRMTLRMVHRQK